MGIVPTSPFPRLEKGEAMATSHFPHREGSWSMTMTISLSFDHDHNLSLHAKEQVHNGEGRDGYGHHPCRLRIEKGV